MFASEQTGWSGSRPVSRVLSWAIIHLGPPSPAASCDLPESAAGHGIAFLFGLAPGGVYLATECCHLRGALLPHHFTLTGPILSNRTGGIFSVALSVGSRPPGVTWHPALWSPDFPPHHADGAIAWPTPVPIISHLSVNPAPSAHRVHGGKRHRFGQPPAPPGSRTGIPAAQTPTPAP